MARNKNQAQFDRYRAWQWIKHQALADHVVPWARKLGSISRVIFIVDLFAGAGTYTDVRTGEKTDGSPVIFARRAARYAEENLERSSGSSAANAIPRTLRPCRIGWLGSARS